MQELLGNIKNRRTNYNGTSVAITLDGIIDVINHFIPLENDQFEDLTNKLNCLNGYLKLWIKGGKIPNELHNVIKECDEYLAEIKNVQPGDEVQCGVGKNNPQQLA